MQNKLIRKATWEDMFRQHRNKVKLMLYQRKEICHQNYKSLSK